jgi:hypothetical protein
VSDVKKDRPWCCVDKRCTPLVISHDHVDVGACSILDQID